MHEVMLDTYLEEVDSLETKFNFIQTLYKN